MTPKERGWLILFCSILVVFGISGVSVLYWTQISIPSATDTAMQGVLHIAYGFHLLMWMLLGMVANYWWNHFRGGGNWDDMLLRDILIPLLISPIVFFGIWAMWPGKEIIFALCLVAFQNGFFWQVIFSKAAPIVH
jgi:hypothetical protein